ncbi:MAG: hypothetical protein HPY61_14330 [Methanotrichaceae archaeon]|nr:hypothetical protein [Methanotrichaceae archaeon]
MGEQPWEGASRALGWGMKEVSERRLKASRGAEEGGSGLRADAGGDGQEAFQRGLLCAGRSVETAVFSVMVEMFKKGEI